MSILINVDNHQRATAVWAKAIQASVPNKKVHCFPDIPNPSEIEYAVIWQHPHGDLLNYPNLKVVLLLGAGTDSIDNDPAMLALQPKVPLVRLLDPDVGNDMAQYTLYWTMHFHRRYEDYRRQSDQAQWRRHEVARSADTRVSVLGMGLIGSFIAQRIALNGFCAQAWNRSAKTVDHVNCFSSPEGLHEMLANTDILINCLPLNEGTRHLLNRQRLSLLPEGSYVINVSRGAVIDDVALLDLLGSGHIAGAALDTFAQEPLQADSPMWEAQAKHANMHITPHMSGATYIKSAAQVIVDNILRVERGEAPFPIHHIEAQNTI